MRHEPTGRHTTAARTTADDDGELGFALGSDRDVHGSLLGSGSSGGVEQFPATGLARFAYLSCFKFIQPLVIGNEEVIPTTVILGTWTLVGVIGISPVLVRDRCITMSTCFAHPHPPIRE